MSAVADGIRAEPAPPVRQLRAARLFHSPRERTILAGLLLVLATLALYQRSLHNGFINFDDPSYVTSNSHVRAGLSWSNIAWALHSNVAGHWHPLTIISQMADVQLFGLNPAGHHLDNVLLHALNVLLLFLLLRYATGYVARSAMVAAFFAVCPLNVEAVDWISERKAVLCTTFLFLTLFAYGRYIRQPGVRRYLTLALFFALGLMSEGLLVTVPFMLLLADFWPLGRLEFGANPRQPESRTSNAVKLVVEKIPLLLLAAAAAWMSLHSALQGGALTPLSLFPLRFRIENAIYSYSIYILKGFWPTHLAIIYPHPGRSLALWKVAVAFLALLAITAAVFRYRKRRYLLVGWLWFLGTMAPVSGIAQAGLQNMADRYSYIPFIGLFVLVVWLVADGAVLQKASQAIVAAVAVAILLAYGCVSYVQIGYWRDGYTVFSHAVQVTTRNAVAENNLGQLLGTMGKPDLALEHYQAAVEFMPQWCTAHYNFAVLLQQQRRFDEAARQFQLALDYETDANEAWQAHNNLGAVLVQLGRPGDAIAEFTEALRITPGAGMVIINRGLVEYSQGRLDAAHADFSRASQLMPNPQSYFWLGRVDEDRAELPAAADAYQSALRLAPELREAQLRLDAIREKLRR